MKSSCTALIPFLNESTRTLYTLSQLTQIPQLTNIICIDDGSTDNAYKQIENNFPHVKLLRLSHNTGKSNAIFAGLQHVTTPYTLLFDADLSNIQIIEIENALQKIITNQTLDMIILRRIIESKFLSLIRHDIVMSGQRVLKTDDLKQVFKLKFEKYQLEMAINDYMIKNNKTVYWMPLSTQNPKKVFKVGLSKSLKFYTTAIKGYISYAGWKTYLNQVRNFCTQQAI